MQNLHFFQLNIVNLAKMVPLNFYFVLTHLLRNILNIIKKPKTKQPKKQPQTQNLRWPNTRDYRSRQYYVKQHVKIMAFWKSY